MVSSVGVGVQASWSGLDQVRSDRLLLQSQTGRQTWEHLHLLVLLPLLAGSMCLVRADAGKRHCRNPLYSGGHRHHVVVAGPKSKVLCAINCLFVFASSAPKVSEPRRKWKQFVWGYAGGGRGMYTTDVRRVAEGVRPRSQLSPDRLSNMMLTGRAPWRRLYLGACMKRNVTLPVVDPDDL